MKSTYDTSAIELIRTRLSLSEIVGRRVILKRRGSSIMGLCPFHKEKTPSFHVRDDKGFYHCFGCGAHGSIFDFLMQTENITFSQALERAATMAGVHLLSRSDKLQKNSPIEAKKACIYKALKKTAHLYTFNLSQNTSLKSYLLNRGIKEISIKGFSLGYARYKKEDILKIAKTDNLTLSHFLEAGILIKSAHNADMYARFRERLIFPIHDLKGKIVGFGGRTLSDEKQPKYLNSPDSEVFHKGEILYGLYQVKAGWPEAQSMLSLDRSLSSELIIVEGYMDVIALQQSGFPAVAPLGTALTENQLHLAWRQTQTPTLCFDGDLAGQQAATRALERALPLLRPGYSLKFMHLPKGEDPDSLLARHQGKLFKNIFMKARPLVDVWWEELCKKATLSTPENKAFFKNYVYKQLNAIKNDAVREIYFQEYKQRLYALLHPGFSKRSPLEKGTAPAVKKLSYVPKDTQAFLILATLLHHPKLIEKIEHEAVHLPLVGQLKKFHTLLLGEIFQASSLDNYDLYGKLSNKGFDKLLEKLSESGVYELAPFARPTATLEEALSGWKSLWKVFAEERGLDEEIAELANELEKKPSSKTWEKLKELNKIRRSYKIASGGDKNEF